LTGRGRSRWPRALSSFGEAPELNQFESILDGLAFAGIELRHARAPKRIRHLAKGKWLPFDRWWRADASAER
jgi:hypothetical protein